MTTPTILEDRLIALARDLAMGDHEEKAAAQVLCLLGACLRKGCVCFVFAELIDAALDTIGEDDEQYA